MTNEEIIAALDEYDAAMQACTVARERLRRAESVLKRTVGAKHETYMDGNQLVAALGRKLAQNIKENA